MMGDLTRLFWYFISELYFVIVKLFTPRALHTATKYFDTNCHPLSKNNFDVITILGIASYRKI